MKLLLHTCCGPCLLYPLDQLHAKGYDVTAYFYNPNIHPYREFRRRLDTLADLGQSENIQIIIERDYDLDVYFKNVVNNEDNRCKICYELRLRQTLQYACEHGFDSFSTTLLYSRYQKHGLIVDMCKTLAQQFGVTFIYRDFREGWQIGIDKAIEKNLYRQPYCGCIYSEQERYDNHLKKRLQKNKKQRK
jgi:epoxyqueuosine reductase